MNGPILRVYVVLLLLFAALVGFTTYWTVFDADTLKAQLDNRRSLIETAGIRRGTIGSVDGEVLARSDPSGSGSQVIYERTYPTGSLFGHPVGYSFIQAGMSGIEKSENDILIGQKNEFATLLDQLQGTPQEGSNLTVTLNANAQRVATDDLTNPALGGSPGSVVAIEPSTGAVRAMVSVPGYDPNEIPTKLNELNNAEAAGSPLVNRATQAQYPPGSTFKVVTATAALDSGQFTPDSVLNGDSGIEISGVPLANDGGASYGPIDMTTALTNSVNTYWAQVGEQLGTSTLFDYMNRFGFDQDPPLDYPPSQMTPSGVYQDGQLLNASDSIDVGRVAIGQERLAVTPLQMAMVAAAVANDGTLMKPTFVQEVTDPDGRVSQQIDPQQESQVMSSQTASELNTMMQNVVNEGTGTAAALSGIQVAGKTGTAEHGLTDRCQQPNQAWFIGFAPADNPQIAVAATVECTSGFGGEIAAPIARDVMESLIH
jgi:peptidoglycan glycosyltransferase